MIHVWWPFWLDDDPRLEDVRTGDWYSLEDAHTGGYHCLEATYTEK